MDKATYSHTKFTLDHDSTNSMTALISAGFSPSFNSILKNAIVPPILIYVPSVFEPVTAVCSYLCCGLSCFSSQEMLTSAAPVLAYMVAQGYHHHQILKHNVHPMSGSTKTEEMSQFNIGYWFFPRTSHNTKPINFNSLHTMNQLNLLWLFLLKLPQSKRSV
ncbi:MAG: hypothetical protein LBK01_07055 [Burkholderiaceae bacterium]|jgi:hypothetical protein|nr:hypothetical protein [Burkholderiaceae bacterium]